MSPQHKAVIFEGTFFVLHQFTLLKSADDVNPLAVLVERDRLYLIMARKAFVIAEITSLQFPSDNASNSQRSVVNVRLLLLN